MGEYSVNKYHDMCRPDNGNTNKCNINVCHNLYPHSSANMS